MRSALGGWRAWRRRHQLVLEGLLAAAVALLAAGAWAAVFTLLVG